MQWRVDAISRPPVLQSAFRSDAWMMRVIRRPGIKDMKRGALRAMDLHRLVVTQAPAAVLPVARAVAASRRVMSALSALERVLV
jgi:hypothetical protein